MGRLFIDNEHDYDVKKHFYCKNCEKLKIEICSLDRMFQIDCETPTDSCFTFFEILTNNILVSENLIQCDMHPSVDQTFCILDLDPVVPQGYMKEIVCKGCLDIIGWYVSYHMTHKFLMGLFFMKKNKLF